MKKLTDNVLSIEESIDLSGCINKKKKEEERQYSFEISSI